MAADDNLMEPVLPVEEGAVSAALAEPVLVVKGNLLHVQNAQGCTMEVYDITGKRVAAVNIDSNDKQVTLNLRKGCYIVKIGSLTRKVSLS